MITLLRSLFQNGSHNVSRVCSDLRYAIYEAHDGCCIYCAFPQRIPLDAAEIDHIIPVSIPISQVKYHLRRMGIDARTLNSFCDNWLPNDHQCLENLTLACRYHNSLKSNTILHPAALLFVLKKSQVLAGTVASIYEQITGKKTEWVSACRFDDSPFDEPPAGGLDDLIS